MDDLLASIGRIAESVPWWLSVPAILIGVLGAAWWRSSVEDTRRREKSDNSVVAELRGIKSVVDAIHTSVEILRDRRDK